MDCISSVLNIQLHTSMCSLCFVNRLLHNWRDVFPRMPSVADQHPQCVSVHDDFIKWKHFPRYWTFARGIHRSPVKSPHEGQLLGALMFSLICTLTNGWVNNRYAGDFGDYVHFEDTIMVWMYVALTAILVLFFVVGILYTSILCPQRFCGHGLSSRHFCKVYHGISAEYPEWVAIKTHSPL